MKKTTKFLISFAVFLILVIPVFSFAYKLGDPIIPCGTTINPAPCNFQAFITLINNAIGFIFLGLVVPIAALMFFYAGFELVTSGGSTEKRGIAKRVFTNAVIGLVIAAGAWLIVKVILSTLSSPGTWTWIGF